MCVQWNATQLQKENYLVIYAKKSTCKKDTHKEKRTNKDEYRESSKDWLQVINGDISLHCLSNFESVKDFLGWIIVKWIKFTYLHT